MNPYLENSELWSEVHSRLLVAISDAISPQVLPKYRVAIEKRIYQVNEESLSVVSAPNKPINVNIPGFYLAIDYTSDPAPKLSKTDTTWAANLLQQQGLR